MQLKDGVASAEPIEGLSEGKSLLQRLKKMHVSRRFSGNDRSAVRIPVIPSSPITPHRPVFHF